MRISLCAYVYMLDYEVIDDLVLEQKTTHFHLVELKKQITQNQEKVTNKL